MPTSHRGIPKSFLAPGHYVLHAAGGTVLDLHGWPLSLNRITPRPDHRATP